MLSMMMARETWCCAWPGIEEAEKLLAKERRESAICAITPAVGQIGTALVR